MKMPGFNAEATLYQTSGHYLTGRHAIKALTQKTSAIHPAVEVIHVHGCRPGYTMVDGECYPEEPLTEPGLPGGGTPPSGPGEGPTGPVPVGGGPKTRPKRPPREPVTATQKRGVNWRKECSRTLSLGKCCEFMMARCVKSCLFDELTEEGYTKCRAGCIDSQLICNTGLVT
jgi:hypothetical protein